MKNWYENLLLQYPFLKFLGSKYTLVFLFFTVWMLFLDNQSYLDQRILNKQIDELEDNKTYYKEEIAKETRETDTNFGNNMSTLLRTIFGRHHLDTVLDVSYAALRIRYPCCFKCALIH